MYTVSLVFALSHAVVLAYLGDPDWGLLIANYIGYWIMGAALIALGLVASSLTANVTVGFILGTAFCLAAVFSQDVLALIFGVEGGLARGIGVRAHFENFTLGVIALPDLVYFVLFITVMLYLNMVLIGKRHWSSGRNGPMMGLHYLVRAVSVIVAAFAISILVGRWLDRGRADTTAEGLNSLSRETVALLKELPKDRAVYIQAYVSPEVPQQHVETRRNLLRMLREFDALGGSRVFVTVHNTKPYSQEAREAEERFSIKPNTVTEETAGRYMQRQIFLGFAVSCGPAEEVTPFLDRGLSVEYELTRSVRVVTNAERRTIGILRTDLKLLGEFNMQFMQQIPPWEIVSELKKQYNVREVVPDAPIPEDIDVLIAALPSSLGQEEMDVLAEYIEAGRPALLLIDPLPILFPQLSPSQPKPTPKRRMYGQPPAPEKKGNIDSLIKHIGLDWQKDVIVWDMYNPVLKLRTLPPEFVFIGNESGGKEAKFHEKEIVSKEIERLVFMFPGTVSESPGTTLTVTPLLRTGTGSGSLRWRDVMTPSPFGFGMNLNPNRRHFLTREEYVLAVRVTGEPRPKPEEEVEEKKEDKDKLKKPAKAKKAAGLNVIVIADIDMISNEFFRIHREIKELRFDNVAFALNCVDFLAGDDSLIALRNRRPRYRSLNTIEKRRKKFQDDRLAKEKEAEDEAELKLKEAQQRLDRKLEKLDARKDIDEKTRGIMRYNLKQVEENRLEASKKLVEAEKKERIRNAEREMVKGIRHIENRVRFWAIILPPLPAILIGLIVFVIQLSREKSGKPLAHSMRQTR